MEQQKVLVPLCSEGIVAGRFNKPPLMLNVSIR
jgi:hypothetical protein